MLSRIPDPNFSIPDPGTRVKNIPDPESGSASKKLSIFHPKSCFSALGYMIQEVHTGSRIRILTFYPSRIRDSGVKKTPDPGSAALILTVVGMTCQSASFLQCCGPESGIRCLFDLWIRDPIKVFSRSRIPNPYFWELISENFLGKKYRT